MFIRNFPLLADMRSNMRYLSNYAQDDESRFWPLLKQIWAFFTQRTEKLQIWCSGCSTWLRVTRPFAGRPRCPKCSTFVGLKAIIRETSHTKVVFAVSVIVFVVGLLPVLWPAGLYLLAAAPLFLLFAIGKLSTDILAWENSNYFRRLYAFTSLKTLRDTTISVIAGLLIICSAQLLLKTFLYLTDEESVKSVELSVIRQQKFLSAHTKLNWLIISIILLLLLQTIFPYIKVAHFKRVRLWTSRVLIVLTVITSFSFFTQQNTASLERDWIAERRVELGELLGRVKKARQGLVTNAYLESQVKAIPPENKDQLRSYFVAAADNNNDAESIDWLILKLNKPRANFTNAPNDYPDFPVAGGGTSKPPPEKGGPAGAADGDTVVEDAIDRVNKWVNAGETERVAPPSLEDARILETEAKQVETLSYASTAIVEQALKEAIGQQITGLDPLIKLFVKTLQNAGVKSALNVLPARVRTFQKAKAWVQKNIFAHNLQTNWDWTAASYAKYQKAMEPPPVTPRPKSATDGLAGLAGLTRPGMPDDWFKERLHYLQCWIEENRLNAANELRLAGPQLSSSQIAQLVSLLGSNETRIRLSENGRFKDTPPLGYYSARALEGMSSEFLNPIVRARAHTIYQEYRTQGRTSIADRFDLMQARSCIKL